MNYHDPMALPPDGSCICHDSRNCFAKTTGPVFGGGTIQKCRILTTSYKSDGECPFCKPHQCMTNGVIYLYNYLYSYPKKRIGGNKAIC